MSNDVYSTKIKHAGGRPTDYTPQIIEELNQYLQEAVPENMKIPTVEGIALRIGINKATLYDWAKIHPEFNDALEELKMKQKECLQEIGIFGGKEINATIVALLLKVNHDMIETTRTELGGINGQPITITASRGFIPPGTPVIAAPDGGNAIEPGTVQGTGMA
jgi:transposase-like protein